MKIMFLGETKRVSDIKQFNELVKKSFEIFDIKAAKLNREDLKLFYIDDDGDIISVSCQSDLDEAFLELKSKVKLCLANNHSQAKQQFITGCAAASDALNK